ncbi:hypothetical protein AB0A73_00250 [Glycomyces sp. NPDC047369]
MTDHPRRSEVSTYLSVVRRHLDELPQDARDDILSDLEAHLDEVAAELEPGATLAGRLGAPEDYAAELRDAVRVEGAPGEPRAPGRLAAVGSALTRAADAVTRSAGAGTFAEFRRSLKPAWWIVRGVAAAGLIAWLVLRIDEHFTWAALERWGLTAAAVAAIALPLAWFSVRVGNRSEGWGRGSQLALAFAGVALVGFTAVRAADVALGDEFFFYDGSGYSPYASVTDVYPYTEDGELVTGVYLLDQHGSPLYLGNPSECSVLSNDPFDSGTRSNYPYGASPSGIDHGYLYPLCTLPEEAPSAEPTGSEEPTTPEEPTSPEDPTATPSEPEPTSE